MDIVKMKNVGKTRNFIESSMTMESDYNKLKFKLKQNKPEKIELN